MNRLPLLLLLASLIACNSSSDRGIETTPPLPTDSLARVPDSWIAERVVQTRRQLEATEAGQLVWRAMEAHGGLERFYQNGPLHFTFHYSPLDGGTARHTLQDVDTWRNLARHTDTKKGSAQYGWDGNRAWVTAPDTAYFEYNLRFWALTPYYFLGQPFVFAGEGVQLEKLADKSLNGKQYHAVKISFAPGTGDAPDDYYIAYFDRETGRQEVIRYIVSYPGYFESGKHLPEKIMTLHDFKTVDGIVFPTAYNTHWLGPDELPGEMITNIGVRSISFEPELTREHFEVPSGAVALEGL